MHACSPVFIVHFYCLIAYILQTLLSLGTRPASCTLVYATAVGSCAVEA